MTSPCTRILAIDPGKVRIGFAISDAERRIASPLTTYTRKDAERDAAFLKRLIEDEAVGQLLLGLPMHLDGREGVQAQLARAFGQQLQTWTGLPVQFWDERYTTVHAEAMLWDAGLTHKRRKQRRDRVAAQILLQTYLDAGCPVSTPGESEPEDEQRGV
jgi:putative Holliday junction resolvase